MASSDTDPKTERVASLLIRFGILSFSFALLIFILTFYPVIREELKYMFSRPNNDVVVDVNPPTSAENAIEPVDAEFGIVVPKISANAPIVAQVDPNRPEVYQYALTKGVAHARGTSLPGEGGNIFLFAHSAGDFYDANRYNAVFYLLYKLEPQDDLYVFYKGTKHHYSVTQSRIVDASEVQYLKPASGNGSEQLTLMTCWPPGTTLKRLVVTSQEVEE